MKRARPFLCLLAIVVSACGQQPPRGPVPSATPAAHEAESVALSALGSSASGGQAYRAASAGFSAGPSSPQGSSAGPGSVPEIRVTSALKLIWTASLQVEVPSFRAAVDEAARAAGAFGGYVSDRQSSEDAAGRARGQITLRIPSEKFDGALSALKRLGRVRNEGVQTQDVTRQYADLETRLKVKRETAARLREILIRQTGKVSEVLQVEREIGRVVEDIEQAEGQRRYFDNLISLSTITLSLFEPDSIVTPGALDPVLAALRGSLLTMSQSLASLIELAAGWLPWLVLLYLAFRLIRGRLRRA